MCTIGLQPYSVHRAPSLWKHQPLFIKHDARILVHLGKIAHTGHGVTESITSGLPSHILSPNTIQHVILISNSLTLSTGSPWCGTMGRDAGLTSTFSPLKRIDDLINRATETLCFSSTIIIVLSFPMKRFYASAYCTGS
ncbi:hypothetical protein JCGZ_08282 [Jatropha curcas]|uniref:Uncharacterized protein n=1 Tax=Jatropha curcas TaxID=180498 RepID=A0A067KMH4_JATCU|nr:hypothetical protein JCGZ_08282 [Jatropha curcas]